jgi:hypothetical protein
VFGGEKVIDGWLRLKLSHHPGQSRAVVMNLGFLHATLSGFVIEKAEHSIERLLQVIQHVNECPALTVMKKIVAGDEYPCHFRLQSDLPCLVLTYSF